MLRSSAKGMQRLMDKLNSADIYGMKINVKKTKVMVVSREAGREVNIVVDGQKVEQVNKFKYLGDLTIEDGRCMDEVKARIGMAKDAFNKRRELLNRRFDRKVKKKMIKTLVWPVALYGCETGIMNKEVERRLEAFEMWLWRRMEKVSWREKRTNEDILQSINENRGLLMSIRKRKKNWIGHVVRGSGLLKLVLEGRMEGTRRRGRKRIGMIDDIMHGSYGQMKRRAEDREGWRDGLPVNLP
jgi:hypothetical protein